MEATRAEHGDPDAQAQAAAVQAKIPEVQRKIQLFTQWAGEWDARYSGLLHNIAGHANTGYLDGDNAMLDGAAIASDTQAAQKTLQQPPEWAGSGS
ncbi:hypothetical protein LN042_36415 [Kitasatospora sp. RB6PN24]|uniref:hypothetical protein n=1 Tax=Kitasatospora humi TaxID=2893891 RepID=UPI001E510765|nr:hypothetical protein [Kitasatospora humi]MCC9312476.1 hypothetical protein [Kitasatospora humi]